MGFGSNGAPLVWKVSELSIKHIKTLFDAGILNSTSSETVMKVDADVSWIARKIGVGKTEDKVAHEVANFLRAIAHIGGFDVTPICDGDKRHDSKRDYANRQAKRERKRIDGLVARYEGMSLEAEIERIKASGGVESESHLKQRKEIKKIKGLRKWYLCPHLNRV